MFKKKIITKTSEEAKRERTMQEMIERENCTCPSCGYYDLFNGGLVRRQWVKTGLLSGRYKEIELFECRKCGCEWEVEKD